jgi:putative transposase
VISDAHVRIRAAVAKVLKSTWQRCRVHFLRNALAHAGKGQRQMVLAMINTAFAQDTYEADVLAFMSFPKAHRVQIHSTNPLERLNAEIKRRTDVVGIFPNEPAITRLAGALLLEQNDEWQLQRRYLPLEGLQALADNQATRLPAVVS